MPSTVVTTVTSSLAVLLLPKLRQDESILDTAAAFQHVFIVRIRVPFANDVGTSKLELWW
jgi:hypothetical protein